MHTREGRPYRQAEGAPQSDRTTDHTTTANAYAREAFLYHLTLLPFVLAAIAVACALLWAVT